MTVKRYGTSCCARSDGVFVLASDFDAVEAERDALRADAERYRWLRERNADYISNWAVENGYEWVGEKLDDAIDAARAKEKA